MVIEGSLADSAARKARERKYVVEDQPNQAGPDNGFDNLTPDDYVQLRIAPEVRVCAAGFVRATLATFHLRFAAGPFFGAAFLRQ